MAQGNPDCDEIFEENRVDTHYPQRPGAMGSVCLYDFVALYVFDGRVLFLFFFRQASPNMTKESPDIVTISTRGHRAFTEAGLSHTNYQPSSPHRH